jgi:hypothetical protein
MRQLCDKITIDVIILLLYHADGVFKCGSRCANEAVACLIAYSVPVLVAVQ